MGLAVSDGGNLQHNSGEKKDQKLLIQAFAVCRSVYPKSLLKKLLLNTVPV